MHLQAFELSEYVDARFQKKTPEHPQVTGPTRSIYAAWTARDRTIREGAIMSHHELEKRDLT